MDYLTTSDLVALNTIHYPNIRIARGQTVFVKGPSGCGKTTLFHMLNGTLTPTGGTIYFNGTDIATMNPLELRKKILLVNQQAFLFPGTIAANFEEYHKYRHTPAPSTEEQKKFLKLAQVDFPPTADVAHLSGGEQQRVFNAIMLSMDAEVFLWDEPTAALDSEAAHAFMTDIKNYAHEHNITNLIITNDDALPNLFGDANIELHAPNRGNQND